MERTGMRALVPARKPSGVSPILPRHAPTRVFAAAAFLLPAAALFAAATPIPPPPERWVTDAAGFLSPEARRRLDTRLESYQSATGHQVIVWIGRTTGDTPIEDFAVRAFQSWRVGRKGLDDGLAIFVLTEDRKVRFEVGYGLEERLPDVIAFRIIREVMAPRLKTGDHDGAVRAGVEAALSAIGDAPSGAPTPRHRPLRTVEIVFIAVLLGAFLLLLVTNPSLVYWLLVSVASSGSRGGGSYRGSGSVGGGWGRGGGFSGGGGRSGGGGATGSW